MKGCSGFMNVNIDNWKEFRIGDLFDVEYGSFIAQKDSVNESDGFPHVTTSGINNGISYYVENSMFDGNCITVASDGAMGASFYQANPYSASNIVSNLVPKENTPLNEYNAQFICSLLRKESEKYSWGGFKFSVGRVRETMLLLPATPSGDPDWDYMEAYMKKMEEKAKERMDSLEEMRKQEKKKIDVSGWGEFHLYDLFDISMGNKFDKSKMNTFEDDVNFVGRSALNNGVVCSVSFVKDKNGEDITPYKAGDVTIALGGSIGSCFIQDRDFYTSQNVCVLINDDMNEYVKKFIVTSIYASCANYEAFVDELNRHIKTDFIIKLPVTSTGTPDWGYMEQYMREMEEKAKKLLKGLL